MVSRIHTHGRHIVEGGISKVLFLFRWLGASLTRALQEFKRASKGSRKVSHQRDRISAATRTLHANLAASQPPIRCQPPIPYQSLAPLSQSSSRRTLRESRFAEKHHGIPLSIYLATKAVNGKHNGPTKSFERRECDRQHSRYVPRAKVYGAPFFGTERREAHMHPHSKTAVPADVFANFDESRVEKILDLPRRDGYEARMEVETSALVCLSLFLRCVLMY